ncbi:MAG: sulfite exporter TauE/SafE family protein [Bacteroidetes bacterium]|nr:sulfite exporter TauE/SafE family protein [Bacteroidota bacterium]
MIATVLIPGFLLGAAGSLHCIGMCGPLSLALPVNHLSKTNKFFSLLFYQFGRVITYSLFGLLIGFFGRGFYLAGLQQWFSIVAGIVILLSAVFYFIHKANTRFFFFSRYYTAVYSLISGILKKKRNRSSFFLLGMANGLLPCGMVYIALATALSFPVIYYSMGFMAMFGAGTLPAMMMIGYGAQAIKPSVKNTFRKSVPYIIACMGLLLILRGLNLGILFISPALPAGVSQTVQCHQ